MTHDFHFYITFMCARNAGYNFEDSKRIALCADGVDGGDMKEYASNSSGKFRALRIGQRKVQPITVHHMKSSVNTTHSMGASLMSAPWIAFHFLPSLNLGVGGKVNPYALPRGGLPGEANTQQRSLFLQSELICSHTSRFAEELIKDTAAVANTGIKDLALLGIRAHIIADLFAHGGFAGCRSYDVNALSSVNNLKESRMQYEFGAMAKMAPVGKALGMSRLGHGQAGQYPDEPYLAYSCTRNNGGTFQKDNFDLYGAAVMTVTEVLRGKVNTDFTNWRRHSEKYTYNWHHLRIAMNQERAKRNQYLCETIDTTETLPQGQTTVGTHDSSDYWAFTKMPQSLMDDFIKAADKHYEWFYKKFFELSRMGLHEYLEQAVLWPMTDSDDKKAARINQQLMGGTAVNVGSTSGDMKPEMICCDHMWSAR